MPDPRILKALKMTPAEWGQVPITGNERDILRKKAAAIMAGTEPAIVDSEDSLRAREDAILKAKEQNVLSRSGFEDAMVQQAKFFGDAIELLREQNRTLQDRITALETPPVVPATE